jgi:hypothetical protein
MCEGFSNKTDGKGDTARTSSLRRFPDLSAVALAKEDSSTPGTRVTIAASAEDEESAAASVLLLASE